jgi:hypothetical protein
MRSCGGPSRVRLIAAAVALAALVGAWLLVLPLHELPGHDSQACTVCLLGSLPALLSMPLLPAALVSVVGWAGASGVLVSLPWQPPQPYPRAPPVPQLLPPA